MKALPGPVVFSRDGKLHRLKRFAPQFENTTDVVGNAGQDGGDVQQALTRRATRNEEAFRMRQPLDPEILEVEVDHVGSELVEDGVDVFAAAEGIGRIEANADAGAVATIEDVGQGCGWEAVVIFDGQADAGFFESGKDAAKGVNDFIHCGLVVLRIDDDAEDGGLKLDGEIEVSQ